MKSQSDYYCLVDGQNRPDFRFLFEDQCDAEKRLREIKASIRNELHSPPREFKGELVDLKRRAILEDQQKTLEIKKISFVDNVDPEKTFQQVIQKRKIKKQETENLGKTSSSPKGIFYSATNQPKNEPKLNKGLIFKNQRNKKPEFLSFVGFRWETSFLRTKFFASGFITLCLITVGMIFWINDQAAKKIAENFLEYQRIHTEEIASTQVKVLGEKDKKIANQFDNKLNEFIVATLRNFDDIQSEELEVEIMKILKGTPMEEMAPLIAKKDRTVAAFMIGIAMQESGLGKHVPVLNGKTCYNNWGYRGIRDRMGSGGHTCFDSPEDAVNTVAGRIERLVQADVDTPREMVLWKCGSSCDGHSNESVNRWIDNVSIHFNNLKEEKKEGA